MAMTFQVKRNENAMYSVSQPCPYSGGKKPLPSVCWKWVSWPKSTTDGLKIQEIARNVSGIIDSIASVVANTVPNRSPREEGMDRTRMAMAGTPIVHHAIGVPSSEIPLDVLSLNRS